MSSLRRCNIPKPIITRHQFSDVSYHSIEETIVPFANEKLNKFSEFILQQSENAEKAHRFEIYEKEEVNSLQSIHESSKEEVSKMEERDKAISIQLAKIRALTYALEQEHKCIRLTLSK
ncbi:hypothetical protein TVAG_153570 [Trichomonas vaginalis G3]|uniref:Uncharacterized protein n=1 Tax=Trichomonas vaginalis (strain ATCC PRA-98 / G3) TaxID=412133 RepID=A2EPR2_TRIV3|nr:hypothetical protein TVAGG3_0352830 [Trichomonas vaginalis G3]EAY05323.1 hypothetical protein TVAG_153570 [Trichomonas vaginalis G3]KAI5531414.1 hypothetical protein TVAGG3_0352830 [Trichomonas vaginalis G3]|eukprot:XP_001317546.1 hypothetical protein [Trichomonas vaginalis G3]